jgi:hypothetical protein
MRNILKIAFLAILVFSSSSALVLADEDEGDESEQEGQDGDGENEDSENENRMPGFEAALAFACSLVAARLLGKTA